MNLRLALFSICPVVAFAQPATLPGLDEVLRRLAENQEKVVTARQSIVYTQETRTRLMRGGSKVAREEKRRYTVAPTATSTEKKLDYFEGRYQKNGRLIPYTDPKFRQKALDIDGDLVESMTDDMVNDKESRDGIAKDLFPLTAKEQAHYTYRLGGVEKVNGIDAIRILFEPRRTLPTMTTEPGRERYSSTRTSSSRFASSRNLLSTSLGPSRSSWGRTSTSSGSPSPIEKWPRGCGFQSHTAQSSTCVCCSDMPEPSR